MKAKVKERLDHKYTEIGGHLLLQCIPTDPTCCNMPHPRYLDLELHNSLLAPQRVDLINFEIAKDVDQGDHTHTLAAGMHKKTDCTSVPESVPHNTIIYLSTTTSNSF